MSNPSISDLEQKGYGYNPLSGRLTGPVDSKPHVYDPKTGTAKPTS